MPPILDLQYESRIPRCRDVISLGLALQEYVSKVVANGAQPAGALVTTERLSKGARAALPGQLASLLWILTACAKAAILDGGLIYQPFASPNDHAQLTDVMQVSASKTAAHPSAGRGRLAICQRRAMAGPVSFAQTRRAFISH